MPTRLLRDWTDSEVVNPLTYRAEVVFTRLIMKVDDYGRFSANPKLLRSLLFPLRDKISDSDISNDLNDIEKCGLIIRYESDGKQFLEILNFRQQLRAQKSKYPAPDDQLISKRLADAKQMKAETHLVGGVCGGGGVCDSPIPPRGDAHDFEIFWKAFPKKVGKKAALKAWKSAKDKPPVADILKAIRRAIFNEWQKDNGSYIPHPSTWLNQGRWMDQGLDMEAMRGKTIPRPTIAPEPPIPIVDEDAAFAFRTLEYPTTINHSPTKESLPFKDWPPDARAAFLKSLVSVTNYPPTKQTHHDRTVYTT